MQRAAIPGTNSIIDHLVIGPGGVFAVDSERWDRRLPVRAASSGIRAGALPRPVQPEGHGSRTPAGRPRRPPAAEPGTGPGGQGAARPWSSTARLSRGPSPPCEAWTCSPGRPVGKYFRSRRTRSSRGPSAGARDGRHLRRRRSRCPAADRADSRASCAAARTRGSGLTCDPTPCHSKGLTPKWPICAPGLPGARPRTLPAAVVPVVVGSGVAFGYGKFSLWRAALALLVALALQVGVNYANDYSDGIRGTDEVRVGPVRLVGSGLADAEARAGRRAGLLRRGLRGRPGAGRGHAPGGCCCSAPPQSPRPGSTPGAAARTATGPSARSRYSCSSAWPPSPGRPTSR